MKPVLIRKMFGAIAFLLGLIWTIVGLTGPAWKFLYGARQEYDTYVFFTIMVPIVTIPGMITSIYGYRLYRNMSETSVRALVGLLSFACLAALPLASSPPLSWITNRGIHSSVWLLSVTLLSLAIYLILISKLLPALGCEKMPYRRYLGKGILMLIALESWQLMFGMFQEYSPRNPAYPSIPVEPWGMIGTFVPILVAYFGYKLAVAILLVSNSSHESVEKPTP